MLMLTRREGERIMIGDDTVVLVKKIKGLNVVQLGIEAPKDVEVHREEIYNRIKQQEEGFGNV